jgi:hypothetical protein
VIWRRVGRYVAVAVSLVLVVVTIAAALNLTGDCYSGVRDCGEGARRLSFVVLGAGAIALAYLVYRFFRGPRQAP